MTLAEWRKGCEPGVPVKWRPGRGSSACHRVSAGAVGPWHPRGVRAGAAQRRRPARATGVTGRPWTRPPAARCAPSEGLCGQTSPPLSRGDRGGCGHLWPKLASSWRPEQPCGPGGWCPARHPPGRTSTCLGFVTCPSPTGGDAHPRSAGLRASPFTVLSQFDGAKPIGTSPLEDIEKWLRGGTWAAQRLGVCLQLRA